MSKWEKRCEEEIDRLTGGDKALKEYADTNAHAVTESVCGGNPYDETVDPKHGAHMVVNISSAHVPGFCELSRNKDKKPYKNGYDLGRYRVGEPPPGSEPKTREKVDQALKPVTGHSPKDIYYGAVELNGSGIRYYGDMCLVVGREEIVDDTVILDRNSFDLVTLPIRDRISEAVARKHKTFSRAMEDEAKELAGTWKTDIGHMAAVVVMGALGARQRRYTIGQISTAICDDEDYVEVLKVGSFSASDLEEVRVSASEAAHDALTGNRLNSRPTPRMESILWRARRRKAETALRSFSVRVRTVTSGGRTRD